MLREKHFVKSCDLKGSRKVKVGDVVMHSQKQLNQTCFVEDGWVLLNHS